jgi:hypothetical protein
MMNDFSAQRQSILVIDQQETQPVTDLNSGTRRKISNANAAKTDVSRLGKSDRLFQLLVFNRQGHT